MDCKRYNEQDGLTASALHPRPEGQGFPRKKDKLIKNIKSKSKVLEVIV